MITSYDFAEIRDRIYDATGMVNKATAYTGDLINRIGRDALDNSLAEEIVTHFFNISIETGNMMQAVSALRDKIGELQQSMNLTVKEWKGESE